MDAVEFLKQFNRMCKAYNGDGCKECPAYRHRCGVDFNGQEEDGVSIVEQWAKEQPVKTRQSEFLKQWPNASKDTSGVLSITPCGLDSSRSKKCSVYPNCSECRRAFWNEGVQ